MNYYSVLADIVVFFHLCYMGYVVLGQLLILIGWPLGWKWIRNPWFRGTHLLMIAVVVVEALVDFECPLTTLEANLRGNTAEVSFTGRVLRSIQFAGDNWPDYVNTTFYVAGAIIVATIFLVPPRIRRTPSVPAKAPDAGTPTLAVAPASTQETAS